MKCKNQQNPINNSLAFSYSRHSIQIPKNLLLFNNASSCILQESDEKIICLTFDEIYDMDLSNDEIHPESMCIIDSKNRSESMTLKKTYWAMPDLTNQTKTLSYEKNSLLEKT